MQRYNNVTTLAIPKNKVLNPNRFIRPQCSKILAIVLFPNIFYFLVGILPVFVTWRSPLRLRYKYSQSARQ